MILILGVMAVVTIVININLIHRISRDGGGGGVPMALIHRLLCGREGPLTTILNLIAVGVVKVTGFTYNWFRLILSAFQRMVIMVCTRGWYHSNKSCSNSQNECNK